MYWTKKKEGEPAWCTIIKKRTLEQNNNFNIVICGETGSGKSWASLKIASLIDPTFNDTRIHFHPLSLMKQVTSKELKPCYVIVLEEVQNIADSRLWWEKTNKVLRFLFSTYRYMRLVTIMNLPVLSKLDQNVADLRHATFQTISLNNTTQSCLLKCKSFRLDHVSGHDFNEYIRIKTNKGYVPAPYWNIKKPDDDLIRLYEEKKREYNTNLQRALYKELVDDDIKFRDKNASPLTEVMKETLNHFKNGLVMSQIAKKRGVLINSVVSSMSSLKKRGYKFKRVYKDGKLFKYDVLEGEVL